MYSPVGFGSALKSEEVYINGNGTAVLIGGMSFSVIVLPGTSSGGLQPIFTTSTTGNPVSNHEDQHSNSNREHPIQLHLIIVMIFALINIFQ
jgi:hypothetical protein